MAKKKSKEELDIDNDLDMGEESESAGGNKFLNILIVLAVIIVWLAICIAYKDECWRYRQYAASLP